MHVEMLDDTTIGALTVLSDGTEAGSVGVGIGAGRVLDSAAATTITVCAPLFVGGLLAATVLGEDARGAVDGAAAGSVAPIVGRWPPAGARAGVVGVPSAKTAIISVPKPTAAPEMLAVRHM
jgi:hypothetical protein